MKKISIKFKNCYGIKKLSHSFTFTQDLRKKSNLIYAPNGAMKTSFAKTFKDFSHNQPSKDLIFPSRVTEREILDENGDECLPIKFFVIDPYVEEFQSERMSTLLVNKTLKQKLMKK